MPDLLDYLAEAAPPVAHLCGTRVTWNGLPGDRAGGCSRLMANAPANRPACDQWFGLAELQRPLYGGRRG